MSDTTSKGDRLLAALGEVKPPAATGLEAGVADAGLQKSVQESVVEQAAAQMAERMAETQRLRAAMLAAGVSEEIIDDPEGAEMDHLQEDEQEQFNDAVREHRAFQDELQRDLRELQRSRDALGIRRDETAVPLSMTKEIKA